MRGAATMGALAIAVLLATLGGTARAVDGVLEISQGCVASGCVPGDGGGYPVVTQAGKSYVLTSNLAVTDADVTAIILAQGATLDLNGFNITGPAVCTGTPPSCVGLGAGVGVQTNGEGATIRNGRISGMGGDGVAGQAGTRVDAMLIEANGDDGIDGSISASAWTITNCRIMRNKDAGIALTSGAAPGGVVSRNAVFGNGGIGVSGSQLAVIENSIYGNAGVGLSVSASRIGAAYNALYDNNGGNANPQTAGTLVETGPNDCDDGVCP